MEKISNIIPNSPRVATVDLKESAPVRPGVPAFGQRISTPNPIDKFSRSGAQKTDVQAFNSQNRYRDPVEARRVSIAERVANSFFMSRANENENDNDKVAIVLQPVYVQAEEVEQDLAAPDLENVEMATQAPTTRAQAPLIGGNLNVAA